MNQAFEYGHVTAQVLQRFEDTLVRGESILLLGAPGTGKGWITRRLRERVTALTDRQPIHLDSAATPELHTVEDLARALRNAACSATDRQAPDEPPPGVLHEAMVECLRALEGRSYLFLDNVDYLPDALARPLLRSLRALVNMPPQGGPPVVAVLTGESDLRTLVYGPASEFNCTTQYVVQGLDRECFAEAAAGRYADAAWMQDPAERERLDYIHRACNGRLADLKLLMGAVRRQQPLSDQPADLRCSRAVRDEQIASGALGHPARYSMLLDGLRRVEGDEHASLRLEELLQSEPTAADRAAPGLLELSGAAVREDGVLRFASPLMEQLVRSHYDDWRLGSLFARRQEWDKALVYLRRCATDEGAARWRRRDDHEEAGALQALAQGMLRRARNGSQAVAELFCEAAAPTLGGVHLALWFWRQGRWELLHQSSPFPEEARHFHESLLPPNGSLDEWPGPPEPQAAQRVAFVVLGTGSPYGRVVALVSDCDREGVLSRDRRRHISQALEDLRSAFGAASQAERERRRLELREQQIGIADRIVTALSTAGADVRDVLQTAADGLRGLGYKRVMFSMVDPLRQRIVGALQSSEDPAVDVPAMTNWAIGDYESDLQPYVVRLRCSVIVEDARTHPLANKEVATPADMVALAIVPIFWGDTVVGTVHVERSDGAAPSREEVADLERFGRQLGALITLSGHRKVLADALDAIPGSAFVLDRRLCVQYANDCARRELGFYGPDPRQPDEAGPAASLGQEVLDEVASCMAEGRAQTLPLGSFGGRDPNRVAFLCQPLVDWKRDVTAALCHVTDLNKWHGMFGALRDAARHADNQEQLVRALFDFLRTLGIPAARFWKLDPRNPTRLVSYRQYGLEGEEAASFDCEGYVLERVRSPGSFRCLDDNSPAARTYDPTLPDGMEVTTVSGLRTANHTSAVCPSPLVKQPGDVWVDFPIMAWEHEAHAGVGKLTIDAPPGFGPEDLNRVRMFCEAVSVLMSAALKRRHEFREAMGQAISLACHNVRNRLGMLSITLAELRSATKGDPSAQGLCRQLDSVLARADHDLVFIRTHVGPVAVHSESMDIVALVENALRGALDEPNWAVRAWERPLRVDVDPACIDGLLLELVSDSKVFRPTERGLLVSVEISLFCRGPAEWVMLAYEDNGPGIPAERKDWVFQPFSSIRPQGQRSTGMGLHWVRSLVEAHGGAIRECGEAGRGVRFEIELPRRDAVARSDTREEGVL